MIIGIIGIVVGFLIAVLYFFTVSTYDDYSKLKEVNLEELEKIMDDFLNQVNSDRHDGDKFESLKADCTRHYNIVKLFLKRDFNKEIGDKFHINLKSIFERKNK